MTSTSASALEPQPNNPIKEATTESIARASTFPSGSNVGLVDVKVCGVDPDVASTQVRFADYRGGVACDNDVRVIIVGEVLEELFPVFCDAAPFLGNGLQVERLILLGQKLVERDVGLELAALVKAAIAYGLAGAKSLGEGGGRQNDG